MTTDREQIRVLKLWNTRDEVSDVFRALLAPKTWKRLCAEDLGLAHEARTVRGWMREVLRSTREWSAPSDLARVDVAHCRDFGVLVEAVEDVLPGFAGREVLRDITDALATGAYGADVDETEVYERNKPGPQGWVMVEAGGKVIQEDEPAALVGEAP